MDGRRVLLESSKLVSSSLKWGNNGSYLTVLLWASQGLSTVRALSAQWVRTVTDIVPTCFREKRQALCYISFILFFPLLLQYDWKRSSFFDPICPTSTHVLVNKQWNLSEDGLRESRLWGTLKLSSTNLLVTIYPVIVHGRQLFWFTDYNPVSDISGRKA